MINEEKTYEEFLKILEETLSSYETIKNIKYPALEIFIGDKVWDTTLKYERMMNITKEKFFESLYNNISVEEYTEGIKKLWNNVDHSYMDKEIKELEKMVIQRDFNNAELYGDIDVRYKVTYKPITELYPVNPESDFRKMERRYMNRHITLYKKMLDRYSDSKNLANDLGRLVERYNKKNKTIPYYYKDGSIKCYNTVATYNSMLYNVNLTRSAWNRAIYDAKLLDNHLWYLPAHPYACPSCAMYQGKVYSDEKGMGYPLKDSAIEGGVGHPNCKHVWVSYWSEEQIQNEKYDSPEWEEKYKNRQKLQSLDLEKARLLSDRRIYKSLEQWDLVDKATARIKNIRAKKKELEA